MSSTEPVRSWPDFYSVQAGRPPRHLLLDVLALWEQETTARPARFAIDLGCGDGTETLVLLERGWQVLAIDQEPEAMRHVQAKVAPEHQARLAMEVAAFEQLVLPVADFIYAGLSLPFCAPTHFPACWARIVAAIRPGGRFAGHFFGERDTWRVDPSMTFHTAEQIGRLLQGFAIEQFREVEEDGRTYRGFDKHWHYFEVIARKAGAFGIQ